MLLKHKVIVSQFAISYNGGYRFGIFLNDKKRRWVIATMKIRQEQKKNIYYLSSINESIQIPYDFHAVHKPIENHIFKCKHFVVDENVLKALTKSMIK